VDETYKVRWNFGDGKEGSQISPTHRYEKPGTYTVDLELVSPIGCKTDTTFRNLITVFEGPEADFTYAPEELSNLNPKAQFSDQSQRAIRWFWDFGDGTTSRDVSPAHTFADTGTYQVALVVTHRSGCTDTLIQTLDVKPLVSYFLPNAFTPNEDAVNDTFKGTGVLAGIRNFNFQIWNRWGGLVFSTDNPNAEWNGRNPSGEEAPPGVYVVLVTFTSPRGEPYEYKGFVTLIR
jgi:gliding motility-associated-like protein